jgi:Fur family zinc uptake transcriptional regulator
MKAGFPKPDHDHARCVTDTLTRAEEACEERGARLTPLRRRVLEELAESHAPVGAYEIVDRLKKGGDSTPAMSVYRALDFLVGEGLAHRIESRNAFLACAHNHDSSSSVAFLICERCGAVGEVAAASVTQPLIDGARATGFSPKMTVVEMTGTCANCGKAG